MVVAVKIDEVLLIQNQKKPNQTKNCKIVVTEQIRDTFHTTKQPALF